MLSRRRTVPRHANTAAAAWADDRFAIAEPDGWFDLDGKPAGQGFQLLFQRAPGPGAGKACRRRGRKKRRAEWLKVLVVDDNDSNGEILGEILAGWNMRSVRASDIPAALTEIGRRADESEAYRLILLDAQMPEMDGYQLLQKIRVSPHADSEIIMNAAAWRGNR